MKKNKKKLSFRVMWKIHGLIFVSPFLIGFIAFFLVPLFNTIYYSLNNVGVADQGGMTFEWTGIQNYINLFQTEVTTGNEPMLRLFTEENSTMLLSLPLIVVFSLFMALLANQKFKGRAVVRLLFFLPIILGLDVVMDMLTITTGSSAGLDTGSNLLAGSYVTIFLVRTLNVPMRVLYPIMTYVENIFQLISQAGVQTLVYLTALQSISPSLYEVAKMEGATAYETFWKVTIPSIMNITFFVVIYTIVDLFLKSSIAEEAYAFAFTQGKIGVGSALSVIYIFNVILVLAIAALLLRKVVKKNEK
ncbi:MAG: sugar ABC transporter permease [Acetatifactor sp.]|jgi:ABC-type sugar transport system permease subunit|nr:sugar ABC transporter permease [Lachnospiraceae bacterium]MDE6167414.1 sugar ABC transporter permease [Acetatifactor sp.]MDE7351812.1 sugar ABC transporter permease [Acetatifactor sp.]